MNICLLKSVPLYTPMFILHPGRPAIWDAQGGVSVAEVPCVAGIGYFGLEKLSTATSLFDLPELCMGYHFILLSPVFVFPFHCFVIPLVFLLS